jgi:hypothetical protein
MHFAYRTITVCGQPFHTVPLYIFNPMSGSYNPSKASLTGLRFPLRRLCTLQLATHGHPHAPPLMGLACLPEFYQRRRLHAYWVSVGPPCRSPTRDPKTPRRLDPEDQGGFARFRLARKRDGNPLTGFSFPSEYYRCAPQHAPQKAEASLAATLPLPRFVPLQRFSSHKEQLPRRVPTHPVVFRPQGFSPSRRLAPLVTYRAYFISNPPMGFALQGFPPPASPYALSNAAPLLWFFPRTPKRSWGPLQGLTRRGSPARVLGD